MKTAQREIFIADARLAVAPAVEGKPVTLSGYALVWNVLSTDRGGYKVRLLPNSALFTSEVHALWNHEYRDLIGTTQNGTLRLLPDDIGIKVEIDLPDTCAGRDVAELVRRRDLRGMSFGIPDEPVYTESIVDGQKVRDYSRFSVDEVTVTPIPAFSATIISVKEDTTADAPRIGYATRDAHSLEIERLKFNLLRLPGAELPSRAV